MEPSRASRQLSARQRALVDEVGAIMAHAISLAVLWSKIGFDDDALEALQQTMLSDTPACTTLRVVEAPLRVWSSPN